MANEPRKPFSNPMPLPTPPGSQPPPSSKEEKKGGAALPLWTSGASDKLAGMPLFRGAGQKQNSLMGRLKSLKTKDMAFIGAGLAVLVMAPLAEYLISEGEGTDKTLTQGFAQNGMQFPGVGDPSEPGIMGLARGGVPGDASDVITPLNARDPSSLIMGGNGEPKEAPAAAAVEPKRDAPKDSVWDKVVSSAKSGASAAARKVSLPKPGGKLAGAINGLRSLSGGSTGASLKLSAPDGKGLFSAPKNESHLAATQAVPGYRGAGPRVIAGGSGGSLAGRNGGGFGGPGGGMAGDVMAGGSAGGGGRGAGFSGGDGDPTKNPGGNSTKDSKTLGESLAFLRQKMEMEKAIDLKWAKKRYDELERKKMIEQTLVQTAQQAFMKVLDKLLEGKKDGAGSPGGGPGSGGSPPGGGKPEGPTTPPGSVAATPAGTGPGGVAPGGGIAHAQEGATKSRKGVSALGESTKALAGDQTALNNLATKIGTITPNPSNPNDPAPAAAAAVQKANGSVAQAKGDMDTANTKLAEQVGVAEKAVKSFDGVLGTQAKSLAAIDKRKSDMTGELAKMTFEEFPASGENAAHTEYKNSADGSKLGESITPNVIPPKYDKPEPGEGKYGESAKGALADLNDAKEKVTAMKNGLRPTDTAQRKLVDDGLAVIDSATKNLGAAAKAADATHQVLGETRGKLEETQKAFDAAEEKRKTAKDEVVKKGKDIGKFIGDNKSGTEQGLDKDARNWGTVIPEKKSAAETAAQADIAEAKKQAADAKKALKGG